MMTTCRLLCALLVLALCCCPSVCATEIKPVEDPSQTTTTKPTTKAPVPNEKSMPEFNTNSVSLPSLPPAAQPQETGQPMLASNGSAAEQGPGSTSTGTKPNEVSNTLQADGIKGTTGLPSDKTLSEERANRESEESTEETTTTTTTKAPTTTTTTAPEAPSTTTTEAPAVSTTRAPSRLREIDGSLSSSAWVCAPLVLAASSLAYNTVG
ncbi:putative mucin TcMUCII [Trypanosoma cruzi]|uniref:Mucin TcMUCII, putative n=2 Tax=Trypanosoma cruzi TaxID=5693 RepID=Q4DWF8_TRYCC|nr:mucin TcMUCII, putative [Trypanosoma cruzi]EAN96849.1 mucin TcMUCII, putative [Trypanosoma cruzi]PWV09596.1 putative mucin TcMUCII [Trypanosoma cruzi]|eukprot:XP_818700.1 mucin TcMUCII [Trypanosoma cruzi strain CL Brener]